MSTVMISLDSPYIVSYSIVEVLVTLSLTFQGQPRSNVKVPWAPHIVSYWCLIVTWGLTSILYEIKHRNLGDLDFDLSRSLKVKCEGAIGLPIYGFLLMFHSNIGPNSAVFREIRLRNLGDLDFDLSKSLKVNSNGAVRLPIYGFLLIFNSNIMSN